MLRDMVELKSCSTKLSYVLFKKNYMNIKDQFNIKNVKVMNCTSHNWNLGKLFW